jgi:Zn finger protein HypA/HybF involved in hydrogenase expression
MRNIEPSAVTVADLIRRGADEVRASCQQCGDSWRAPITFLPSATTLEKIGQLMICPACGGRKIVAAAAWPGDIPKFN